MLGRLRYGSDGPDKGIWCVDQLQPHVAIAFKRLFTKVRPKLAELYLSDTDEVRADLEWFLMRYPLETKWQALLAEGSARMRLRAAEREEILSVGWKPPSAAGARLHYPPYLYQEQAAAIALQNNALLLGDDVGLGKTETALLAAARGAPLPMAIVVQPHLVKQWARRAREFTSLTVHEIKSTTPYKLPEADLFIFSYSKLAGWIPVFDKGTFPSVVYDEVQELRHGPSTAKGNAAAVLTSRARFRMGLTATPIYNYGDEMHTVMGYVQPDVLGTRDEFTREWCGYSRGVSDPDGLGSFLRSTGYFVRRTEHDETVDKSMPPPNVIDVELDYDELAVAKEEEILRTLATSVLRGNFAESGQAARELDVMMRLITGVAKAKSVAAYVNLLLREREKVIIAGWHRDVYAIWLDALSAHNPVLYTGSETAASKQRSVDLFVDGDSRVIMISLRSGAGLDGLQHVCRDVVFGELDWSPQVHKQLIGRARRPGQNHQVTAHYLHVNGGSDPVLMQLLGRKSDQSRGILDPGLAPAARFTDDSRIKALARFVLDGSAA